MRRGDRKGLIMAVAVALLLAACGQTKSDKSRNRAYAGAPPTIPHAVEALGRGNCLGCHKSGLEITFEDIGTVRAPMTPHPYQEACRQCHVLRAGGWIAYGKSEFVGAVYPSRGTRAHPKAPPTIPHRLQNRENCLACHGKLGNRRDGGSVTGAKDGAGVADMAAPESPHKDRSQCRQCHVPGIADFRFRMADLKSQ